MLRRFTKHNISENTPTFQKTQQTFHTLEVDYEVIKNNFINCMKMPQYSEGLSSDKERHNDTAEKKREKEIILRSFFSKTKHLKYELVSHLRAVSVANHSS